MKKYTYIYGLKDSRKEYDCIRYIGKSDNPEKRLISHLRYDSKKKKTYKINWIKKLVKENLKPELVIIEKVLDDEWENREKYWIKYYRKKYGKLITNTCDGGGRNVYSGENHPMYGKKHTVEAKKKIGIASKNRENIGDWSLGKKGKLNNCSKNFLFILEDGRRCLVEGEMQKVIKNGKISWSILNEIRNFKRKNYRKILYILDTYNSDKLFNLISIDELICAITSKNPSTKPLRKRYIVFFKNGKTLKISNLKSFAKNNNLSYDLLLKIKNNIKVKNNKILKIDKINE